jgi:chemotaxis protein histidine kinase CheA
MSIRALFLVACILAISGLDAAAVERINPHDVLNQTRRDLNAFDKRRERDKAEQQKQEKEAEAKRKQEEAERQKAEKAEKALQEAQRKREAAEQQKQAREDKEREARQKQEEAERQKAEKAEKALQEAQRKREAAEQQKQEKQEKQEKEDKEREARKKQDKAERPNREQAEKALQEAQRKREGAAAEAVKGASLSSPTTTPSQPAGRAGSKFEEDPTVTASVHPAGPHHLPAFFTAPGETDVLMIGVAVFLVIAVVVVGILFLRLHTLPERIAHKSHKLQFEIVAVLGLLALFTHVHLFWVAGLLLAMIDLPDFGWPLGRIAGAVETMAGMKPGDGAGQVPNGTVVGSTPAEAPVEAPRETRAQHRQKELTHA